MGAATGNGTRRSPVPAVGPAIQGVVFENFTCELYYQKLLDAGTGAFAQGNFDADQAPAPPEGASVPAAAAPRPKGQQEVQEQRDTVEASTT